MPNQPTVQYIESFIVTGWSVRTKNSDEFDTKTAKLPDLWHRFYTNNRLGNAHIFGVYSHYDSDANGAYTVTAGVVSSSSQLKVDSVTIEAGHYLVFQGIGPMPATVVATWQRVWDFFETHTEYRRNFISDFEAYEGSEQVAVYIGLQ